MRTLVLPLLLLAAALPAQSQVKGSVGLAASWQGLMPGVSREANVVALLGPGFFQDTIGDTGSRTYVSDRENATVVIAFGIDHIIDRIEITSGTHYPPTVTRSGRKRMQVAIRDPKWSGWQYALPLGSTKQAVLAVLGKPTGSLDSSEWLYTAYGSAACEGPSIRFTFAKASLNSIEFLAPEYE